jgi:ABC-2 type transport system permease protein
MKRYLKLYKSFIRNCIVREMEFRLNFFLSIIMYFSWMALTYLSIQVMYSQINYIGTWDQKEGTFLFIISGFTYSLLKAFLLKNVTDLPEKIRNGNMDFLLTKPVNTRFLVSTRYFKLDQFPRLLVFFILIPIVSANISDALEIKNLILGFTLCLIGTYAMYCFAFIISCIAFWRPRIWNLWAVIQRFMDLSDRPSTIFEGALKYLVYIIPIAAFATIPTQFFLGQGNITLLMISIGVTIIFTVLSSIIWKLALRRYESASS